MGLSSHGFNLISFYTPDYKAVADRLRCSCDIFDIQHEILEVPHQGTWLKGVAYKPKFIQQMWRLSAKPIVWVDADAVIKKHPYYFELIKTDIAVHFRSDKRYKNELLSGTMFFNKTEGAKRIIDKWVALQEKEPEVWDQRTLQSVVESEESISVYRLPASYTQIYDTMADRGEPVIEHYQESRNKDKTAKMYNAVEGNP